MTTDTTRRTPSRYTPVHDLQAETMLLAVMLRRPDAVAVGLERCTPDDFYSVANAHTFAAIAAVAGAGNPVETKTVCDELERQGLLEQAGGANRIAVDIVGVDAYPSNASYYAERIIECRHHRDLQAASIELLHEATAGAVNGSVEKLLNVIEDVSARRAAASPALPLGKFLAEPDPDYEWLIPGLLEARDRVILTGREGKGKSTLLRQIAVTAAAGIHPFTLEPIDPLRVLLVDLENSDKQTRRKLRPLAIAARDTAAADNLLIHCRTEGLDLLTTTDAVWLEREVAAVCPDVLVVGPLYKMALGDPLSEEVARMVAFRLDSIRARHGCAILMEAHSPHESNGGKRPERPYGASLWLRWPEFGLFLGEAGEVRHWRGQRDERGWPAAMRRGGTWPWTPTTAPASTEHSLADAIVEILATAGQEMSQRDLAGALRSVGMSARTELVNETAQRLTLDGRLRRRRGGRGGAYLYSSNPEHHHGERSDDGPF